MRSEGPSLTKAAERRLAARLFNRTWDLLTLKRRTERESAEMLHSAHASTYHWSRVGTDRNVSIGEWQVSRVYATLRRAEPALYHGERALRLAQRGRLAPFYRAYGHEAIARAYAVAGRAKERDRHLRAARALAPSVRDRDDRRMLLEDLATVG
jgi:hypothetical protein